jgi:hypothetical protein
MALTPSQSRLEDLQAKEKFATENEYDYSNPVQGFLQTWVEDELDLNPEEDRLIPRPGRVTINSTQQFKLTQRDIDAYCAAHPQVCAPASQREEIYNRLASGGTQIPEPQPEQPESQDYVPTKMVPPLPTSGTHKVIINQTSFSAVLRVSPSLGAVALEPLFPEQQLIVLDEAVGPQGAFVEVKTLEGPNRDKRLYTLREFLMPLPQTKKSARINLVRMKSLPNSSSISPRWTDKEVNVPYYDGFDAKYKVSVETEYDSPGEEKITERMTEALRTGLQMILKETGKESSDEVVDKLLLEDYFIFARAEDYFVDSKANFPMRVLVTLPFKYIPPLEDKREEEEFDFSVQFPLNKLLDTIALTASKIKSYGPSIKDFESGGMSVQTFDTEKESKLLEDYYVSLGTLVSQNEVESIKFASPKSSDFIIIGWREGYEASYVALLNQQNNEKIPMRVGFESFKKEQPVEAKRTQELIHKMREAKSFKGMWSDFISTFSTVEPVVVVFDESKKDTNQGLDSEIGPPVKSREQMSRENRYLSDDERRVELYEERKNKSTAVALVGMAAEDFPRTARQVNSLESAYERVLNNVNLPFLISEALACLGDIRGLRGDIRSTLGFLSQIHKIPSAIFPDDLPTDDISAAYVSTLKNTLEGMLSSVLISLVKGILGSLGGACEEPPAEETPSLEDLLNAMGKMEGEFDRDKAASFIDDLFNVLTPVEICELLEGNPSDKTLEIAQSLLRRLYPELGLETKSQIIDFFATLGSFINFQLCRDILDEQVPDTDLKVEDFLCEDLTDPLREELLRNKGGMTEDQIREQLAKDKQRKEQLADQLLSALESGPLSDAFKTPDLFCAKGSNDPGAASFVDESFSLMLRETLEGLFGSIITSFNREGDQFSTNTLEQIEYTDSETGEELFRFEPVPQFKEIIATSIPRFESSGEESESFSLPVISDNVTTAATELRLRVDEISSLLQQVDDVINTAPQQSLPLGEEEFFQRANFSNPSNARELTNAYVGREELEKERSSLIDILAIGGAQGSPTSVDYSFNSSLMNQGKEINQIIVRRSEGSNDVVRVEEDIPGSYLQYFREKGLEISDQSPSKIFANLFRTKFIDFVSAEEMDRIYENARTTVYNSIKNKFLRDISNKVISSPFLKKLTNGGYGIELIDLSPQTENPECDVHLLKVKTLIKDVEGQFDQNFCLDYDSLNDTTGDEKNPMEAAIMEACVRLTARHYLVEMLLKSVFTMSAFDSTADYDKIKFSFIKDMTKLTMLEYSAQYYDDFLIEVHEIIAAPTKEESFVEMLRQEYEVIIEPLQNALLLPKSRPSMVREILQEIIEKTNENLEPKQNSQDVEALRSLIKERIIKIQFESPNMQEHNRFFYNRRRSETQLRRFISYSNRLIDRGVATKEEIMKSTTIVDSISLVEDVSFYSNMDNFSKVEGFSVGENKEQLTSINVDSIHPRFVVPISEVINPVSKFLIEDSTNPVFKDFFVHDALLNQIDVRELTDATEINVFFDFFFPIEKYKATFTIHEIVTLSTNSDIRNAFSITRDELNSLFYTITPEKDDWKKQNPNLSQTSAEDITSIVDLEFGVKDTPCGDLSWNYGLGVNWGKPYKGFNFSFAAKAAKDAALQVFKDYVEQNDPNIKLARALAFLSKLACVNIPTTAFSGSLTLIKPPTQLTLLYNALGLGLYEKKRTRDEEELSELGLEERDPCTGELIRQPVEETQETQEQQEAQNGQAPETPREELQREYDALVQEWTEYKELAQEYVRRINEIEADPSSYDIPENGSQRDPAPFTREAEFAIAGWRNQRDAANQRARELEQEFRSSRFAPLREDSE